LIQGPAEICLISDLKPLWAADLDQFPGDRLRRHRDANTIDRCARTASEQRV